MSDMLEAEWRQQMRQESQQAADELMKQMQGLFDFSQEKFITLPKYKEDTNFKFDISPAKLCDRLYDNTVSTGQVYTVLANTHTDYLVQLQATMKEHFNRLDFEPKRSAGVDGAGRLARRALAVIQTGHVIGFKRFDVGGVIPSISS